MWSVMSLRVVVNLVRERSRTHVVTPRTTTDGNENFISLYDITNKGRDQQTTAQEVYCLVWISLWSHYWFHVPPFNCHFDNFQNTTNLTIPRRRQALLIDIYLRLVFFSAQNSKTNSAGAKFPLIVGILGARGDETPQKTPKTPKTLNFDSKMTFRIFLEIISQVKAVICSCGLGTGVMRPPGLDLIHTTSLTKSRCRQK